MKIVLQTPDFKATEKLEKFVHDQVEKLDAFYELILESQVCLKMDHSDTQENKICEIRVAIKGNDLFASKQTASFEESVTKCIDALKHQFERLKTMREKLRTSRGINEL